MSGGGARPTESAPPALLARCDKCETTLRRERARGGHTMTRRCWICTLELLASACASGIGGPSHAHRAPDVISGAEMQELGLQNAYEGVLRLRPSLFSRTWAGGQREGMSRAVLVYIDQVLSGSTETLLSIPTSRIASIRFVDRSDPESGRVVGGAQAILVSTIRPGGL
jgi:hypothetical protein